MQGYRSQSGEVERFHLFPESVREPQHFQVLHGSDDGEVGDEGLGKIQSSDWLMSQG